MARPFNRRLLRGLSSTTPSPLVLAISAGIARQEGMSLGNGQYKNNNPGNIMDISAGHLQVYPTPEAGWAALYNQTQLNINRGLTLNQFFGGEAGVYPGYAPAAAGNDPAGYASNVSGWTGIPTNVPLNQLQGNYSGSSDSLNAGNADYSGGDFASVTYGPSLAQLGIDTTVSIDPTNTASLYGTYDGTETADYTPWILGGAAALAVMILARG